MNDKSIALSIFLIIWFSGTSLSKLIDLTIFLHGKRKSKEQKYYELCIAYLEKYQKYSEHFQNLKEKNNY